MITIVPIVEGKGDKKALPRLVGRYFDEIRRDKGVHIDDPLDAGGKGGITNKKNLEMLLNDAATNKPQETAILISLDADADCSRSLAIRIATCASRFKLKYPVGVIVANRMFECWIISSISEMSKERRCGLRQGVRIPKDPELLANPKSWLESNLRFPPYVPNIYQERMANYINFTLAKAYSRSFRRLLKTLDEIAELNFAMIPRGYVLPHPA